MFEQRKPLLCKSWTKFSQNTEPHRLSIKTSASKNITWARMTKEPRDSTTSLSIFWIVFCFRLTSVHHHQPSWSLCSSPLPIYIFKKHSFWVLYTSPIWITSSHLPNLHAGPSSKCWAVPLEVPGDAHWGLRGFLSKSDDITELKSAQLLKCGLAVRDAQNLEAVSMQLWVRVTSRSSSAWTLAAPDDDDRAVFVEGLFLQNLVELVVLITLLFFVTSIWTENIEWTGLWSENLDSPLKYHICFSPSPFHKILSHLPTNFQPN